MGDANNAIKGGAVFAVAMWVRGKVSHRKPR
jgi:hypothetical protein